MENVSAQIHTDHAEMKLRQLTAILSAVTGGNGVGHMNMAQVQDVLNACHDLAADALQSFH